jgi:phage-related protein
MPLTELRAYRDDRGTCPVLEWLNDLEKRQPKAHASCVARILELRQMGHELRRPAADYLCDGIRELRCRDGKVQYRILYSFIGKHVAIVSHGITKESEVPSREIELAIRRVDEVKADILKHTIEFPE